MTTKPAPPSAWGRLVSTLLAVAFAGFLLASYWPLVKLFDLSRADLSLQGVWIGEYAKQITVVTPGGVADRAGLRVGDILEFDPGRAADWVLAGYRHMPERFSTSVTVRRADGSRDLITLSPERVAYLPTLNDRVALLARLVGFSLVILVGTFLVWAQPSVMTWSLLLGLASSAPARFWSVYGLAFEAASPGVHLKSLVLACITSLVLAFIPFSLSFPRSTVRNAAAWQWALGLALLLSFMAYVGAGMHLAPFEREATPREPFGVLMFVAALSAVLGIAALARTYHKSGGRQRARLKWVMFGMSGMSAGTVIGILFLSTLVLANPLSGSGAASGNWVMALTQSMAIPYWYAILRQRVVDVQFVLSRTVVFGVVSTIALAFIAAVHWLLGRLLEHSGLAIGLEGLAAVGLGLVLHRTSHGINMLVDRLLFREHHQAEERLRRVTAALPYATEERTIADSLVIEPVRNLHLASAALFYRESSDAPLQRVRSHGWSESHASRLDADNMLVRYLQAEHAPINLDDPQFLPANIPEDAAMPVLAIPVVHQHVLSAIAIYGSHENHTLIDPDEVELLHELAKAAATSHQQVRIATLARENSALARDNEAQQKIISQLDASLRALAKERHAND